MYNIYLLENAINKVGTVLSGSEHATINDILCAYSDNKEQNTMILCCSIHLCTKNFRFFVQRIDYPIGSSQRPMTWDDLKIKFSELTDGHFSSDQHRKITMSAENLANHQEVTEYTGLFKK